MTFDTTATEGTLTVAHHRGSYLVPWDHPRPEELRRRLDRVAEGRLPELCARLLAAACDGGDDSVWLVRRLEVDLTADLGAVDDETLARAWSGRLARALARTLARGADAGNVVRFADRGEYLAAFVENLAAGRAGELWIYRPFASLRSLGALGTGAAIREALAREPERIAAVLVHLAARGRLERVLGALGEADARRLLEDLLAAVERAAARSPSPLSGRRVIGELLAVWPRAGPGSPGEPARDGLRLLAAALARTPALAAAGALPGAFRTLRGLARILRRVASPAVFGERMAAGELSGAVELARGGGDLELLPTLLRIAGGDGDWLREVVGELAPSVATAVDEEHPEPERIRTFTTPCAGIFLLLPSFLDLGLHRLTAETARSDELAAALRHLLFLKLLGRPRLPAGLEDLALRWAAGLGDGSGAAALRALAEAAGPQLPRTLAAGLLDLLVERRRAGGRAAAGQLGYLALADPEAWAPAPDLDLATSLAAAAVLRHFAGTLPGFGWSSFEHLHRNFLAGVGTVRAGPEEVRVELPPSPLRLVLGMSGADGRSFALPWLGELPVTTLLPPD